MPKPLRFAQDKRRRPYWRDERLLGKTYLDRQNEAILEIGTDTWSRQEVVDDLHCAHIVAAHNLTRVARKLQVESLEQLTARFTIEDLFAQEGFGMITAIVLLCAQEARHKDPIKWIDQKHDDVTLSTRKHRVLKIQHEKDQAARKAARAARQTA